MTTTFFQSLAARFRKVETDAATKYAELVRATAQGDKPLTEATAAEIIEGASKSFDDFQRDVERIERRAALAKAVAAGEAAQKAAAAAEVKLAELHAQLARELDAVHAKFRPQIATAEREMLADVAAIRGIQALAELRRTAPKERINAVNAARRACAEHNAARDFAVKMIADARRALDAFDRSAIGRRKDGQQHAERVPFVERLKHAEQALVEHDVEARRLTAIADRLDATLADL